MIAPAAEAPSLEHLVQQAPKQRTVNLSAQTVLLFFGTAALYWLTATNANTFDAVAYANQIGLAARTATVRGLFHPHHLLFNAVGFLIWQAARHLGYSGGPLVVLQRFNAVVAAAGVALFFATLRRCTVLPIAWALTGLLAFSFGWWICATDGRVNMMSTVLLLAAFAQLRQMQRAPTIAQAVACGLLSGTAVLFHESAGLFVVVGLTGMALASPQGRAQRLILYGAAWASMVIAPYLIAGIGLLHLHSPAAFRHWADAYAEQGEWWDFRILRNLRLDAYALRHALFVEPFGRAALGLNAPHSWPGRAWRSLILVTLRLLYLGALAGWLAALTGLALALPRLWRSHNRPLVTICLIWIGVTGAFFTIWCPGYFVFWTPALVPLLTLLGLAFRHFQREFPTLPLRRGLLAWVALCVFINTLCGILPGLRPSHALWRRMAADARLHTGPHDLLIVPGAGLDGQCEVEIPYFANRACLSVHEILNQSRSSPSAARAALQSDVTRALLAGRKVYVYAELWQDPKTVSALEMHHPGIHAPDLAFLFLSFRQVPAWISPRGPVLRLRLRHAPPTAGNQDGLTTARIRAYNSTIVIRDNVPRDDSGAKDDAFIKFGFDPPKVHCADFVDLQFLLRLVQMVKFECAWASVIAAPRAASAFIF